MFTLHLWYTFGEYTNISIDLNSQTYVPKGQHFCMSGQDLVAVLIKKKNADNYTLQ